MSRCGGCTLCCDLLEVKPLDKPAYSHCPHCTDNEGCAIWQNRPPVCRKYACLWYANPKFSDALRPDRCGALFEPIRDEKIVIVNVNPLRSEVWKDSDSVVYKLIQHFLTDGTAVIVIIGSEKHFILPDGVTEKAVLAGVIRGAKHIGLVIQHDSS